MEQARLCNLYHLPVCVSYFSPPNVQNGAGSRNYPTHSAPTTLSRTGNEERINQMLPNPSRKFEFARQSCLGARNLHPNEDGLSVHARIEDELM